MVPFARTSDLVWLASGIPVDLIPLLLFTVSGSARSVEQGKESKANMQKMHSTISAVIGEVAFVKLTTPKRFALLEPILPTTSQHQAIGKTEIFFMPFDRNPPSSHLKLLQ